MPVGGNWHVVGVHIKYGVCARCGDEVQGSRLCSIRLGSTCSVGEPSFYDKQWHCPLSQAKVNKVQETSKDQGYCQGGLGLAEGSWHCLALPRALCPTCCEGPSMAVSRTQVVTSTQVFMDKSTGRRLLQEEGKPLPGLSTPMKQDSCPQEPPSDQQGGSSPSRLWIPAWCSSSEDSHAPSCIVEG